MYNFNVYNQAEDETDADHEVEESEDDSGKRRSPEDKSQNESHSDAESRMENEVLKPEDEEEDQAYVQSDDDEEDEIDDLEDDEESVNDSEDETDADHEVEESEDYSDNEIKESLQLLNSGNSGSEERKKAWLDLHEKNFGVNEGRGKVISEFDWPCRYLNEGEIADLVPLLCREAADNEDLGVKTEAILCLSEIALHKYDLLLTQKRVIAHLLATSWDKKEVFEVISQLFEQSPLDEDFFRIVTEFKIENFLPSYITTLALLDERMNQETVLKWLQIFASIVRSQFQREWVALEKGRYGWYYAVLLKNFLLGSLGNVQAQITSSQVIAETCILMFSRQEWDLVYYLKTTFEKDNTRSRQILMRKLAKNLNSMEENFKEQALRLIMLRLVEIDRADPMHNPLIVAEMQQLLDALNRKTPWKLLARSQHEAKSLVI
ncbi:hypothetical protein Acr_10g0004280 [Actinidia rufa]|uniref:ARM repeat superfamily protein n=1 Tax=Actinidia rufa TaxID=165716 RepID=A0A7J0F8V9_9ERIC|nr:hypothetical protein Acr_10g0004280 [Actinidia rufa]